MNKARAAYEAVAEAMAKIDPEKELTVLEPFPWLWEVAKDAGMEWDENPLAGCHGVVQEWAEIKDGSMRAVLYYLLNPAHESGTRCRHDISVTLKDAGEMIATVERMSLPGPIMTWEDAAA